MIQIKNAQSGKKWKIRVGGDLKGAPVQSAIKMANFCSVGQIPGKPR